MHCCDVILYARLTNEWYAKDISRKVRSSKKLRGNAGDPMCPPPYGYKKDPDNPRKWIIDDAVSYTHLTLPTNREV